MIDRYWMFTKDDRILEEFYPSIKKCHDFMRGLSSNGWLGMPDCGGSEWYENMMSKYLARKSRIIAKNLGCPELADNRGLYLFDNLNED